MGKILCNSCSDLQIKCVSYIDCNDIWFCWLQHCFFDSALVGEKKSLGGGPLLVPA